MTCVVAVEHKGKVFMAADSLMSDGENCWVVREPKCWRHHSEFVIGVAGMSRAIAALRLHLDPPSVPRRGVERWVGVDLIAALDRAFKLAAIGVPGEAAGEIPERFPCEILVGVAGRVWSIDPSGYHCSTNDGHAATGTGHAWAMGSLDATTGQAPKTRLRAALAAAEAHSVYVRRPFRYTSI